MTHGDLNYCKDILAKFKLNKMTCGKLQLVQKVVIELDLMTCGRVQLAQKNHGIFQIKSNKSWKNSIKSKRL
jgi:hypothetical protein